MQAVELLGGGVEALLAEREKVGLQPATNAWGSSHSGFHRRRVVAGAIALT